MNRMHTCAECGNLLLISKGPDRTRTNRGKTIILPNDFEYEYCPNCKAEWMTATQINDLSDLFDGK